ncbi:histidine kinase [Agrococcus terreus]|uniref:sensor histidine kinase n=1 Tax=Agrococcus terreus TaxID=574649 RepID=UPI00384B1749
MTLQARRSFRDAFATLPIARRPRILLTIGGVLLIAVEGVALLLQLDGSSWSSLLWVVAAGGVVVVAAWLPVWGAALTLAIALLSSVWDVTGTFQLGIAVVAAIIARTCTTTVMVVAGACYIAWAALVPGGGLANLTSVLLTAVCALIGAVLRAADRRHRALEGELLLLEQRRRAAISAERTRIAIEMHDVVAHALTVVAMHASVLDRTTDGAERARSQAAIGEVSRQAVDDMRTMLTALHADEAQVDGGEGMAVAHPLERLEALAERLRAAGIPTSTQLPGEVDLPAPLLLAVVRIAQEATTNILKHAPGSASARLEVTLTPEGVVVQVENSAAPSARAPAPPSGFGLVGLQERTKLFGGALTTGRLDDTWRVRAELPRSGRPATGAPAA